MVRLRVLFLKKEDAEKAAKGYGFWGSDGVVLPINLYENYKDYEDNK